METETVIEHERIVKDVSVEEHLEESMEKADPEKSS